MPDKQEIEFVIKPDGTVEEQVNGVVGPDCARVTEAIERGLGKVVDREHRAEFYGGTAQQSGEGVSSGSTY